MFIPQSMTVRQKLTLIIFLVSMVVLCLSSFFSAAIELRNLRQSMRENLVSISKILADNTRSSLASHHVLPLERALNTLRSQPDVLGAYFFYSNGNTAAAYVRDFDEQHRAGHRIDPEVLEVEERQLQEGMQTGQLTLWESTRWMSLFTPVQLDQRLVGYLYLRAETMRYQQQALWLLFGWLVVLGVAALLSLVLSRNLQRVVSEPIELLLARMKEVPLRHRYSARDDVVRNDEFATLFAGFDEMVGALEARDRQLLKHQQTLEDRVRSRTEELRKAKDEAEAATVAKSRFLANVSHEVRTPMVGILGMSDLLRQSGLPDREKRLAETVYQSGEALLHILNDLLDLSKAEAGKLMLEAVPFELLEVAEKALQIMRVKAAEKGLDLNLVVHNDGRLWVRGDAGRLRQVLLNLLSNAIKFTEVGEVCLEVQGAIDRANDVARVELAVRDTGLGLRAEDFERIFESFHQVDVSTTRVYGGTGLGLAIVRQLIDEMGGCIALESELGQGSCFTVRLTLPLAEPAAPVKTFEQKNEEGMSQLAEKKVLLAEDNPTTQQLLQILLENVGVQVHIVSNGQEALDFLSHREVDLVFMDCHMPLLDGIETTECVRSKGLHVPIIALTAHACEEDEERCLAAGMNDFLGKPFRKSDLEAILAKWLSKSAVARGAIGVVPSAVNEP